MPLFNSKIHRGANRPAAQQQHDQAFFGVQAKLNIGKADDAYEREADHVADQVVQKTQNTGLFGETPFFPAAKKSDPDIQAKESVGKDEQEIQEKPLSEGVTPLVQTSMPDPPEDESGTSNIQTKCTDCEKNEQVQRKAASCGPWIQRKCDKCAQEELQRKPQSVPVNLSGIVQRKEGIVLPEVPKVEEPEDALLEAATEKAEMAKEGSETEEAPAGGQAPAKGEHDLPVPAAPKIVEPEPPEPIQEKSESTQSSSPDISSQLSASKGKGSPMDTGTHSNMSQGFGADFSNVRIHTGSDAVQMNKDIGAQAFTNGSDIYFNSGKYNPSSDSGKFLLAHELTHTIQQGASGDTVQRFVGETSTVTPEPSPAKPNDGSVMEGKANSKIDGDENVKNQDDLSEEEAAEKKDPPRDEVRAENAAVQSEGVTQAPVDRGGQAAEKIGEQKAQMNEKLGEAPPAGEGDAQVQEGEGTQDVQAAGAQQAAAAQAAAAAVPIPDTPQPFKQPNVVAPVDSAGEALPRKANIDTQVRGLGYIGEMLRIKGYELKKAAAEKTIHAHGLDGVLGKQLEDLENARAGTATIEDHNEGRKEISGTSKEVLTDSKERQSFVASEAPKLVSDADGGKADSGGLASEAESKAAKSKSEIPDDEDARADAEKQSGDMSETADGAKSMDDAVTMTADSARQQIADAELASADNIQSEAQIAETDSFIGQIDGRIAEMKAKNDESDAAIAAVSAGPQSMRDQAVRTAQTGDELIAATIYMESELNSLQDEYLASMAAIESKEAAEERIKKEQEKEPPPAMSPEEEQLFALAAMSDEEQTASIQQMPDQEKTGLMAALEKMMKQVPDNGTDATEGARTEVKLGSLTPDAPADPRQAQIDAVDNQRITRLSGVLDVADVNMSYLTEEQQRMLAEKLVGESITDDIKNISVLQMGKDMIKGMIDPRVGLQGAVDGFGKTLSGVANIFNAEAWSKDPLGNLLQIGADISTGLAMIFSSILGLAGMVTAVMVALIIISWGFATPFAAPVIGWMGTVMTYAGWGAIIAGSLSVLFNRLAYIKNLNDAGTASTARELFGNTEQMKQNVMDGFTGAMSIVEGVGAVKMGPMMKSGNFIDNIPKSPGAFMKQTVAGAKDGLHTIASIPGNIIKGAKKLFASGKAGMKALKDKIKKFFGKSNKLDVDGPDVTPGTNKTQHQTDILDDAKTKSLDDMTPEQRRLELNETSASTPKEIGPDSPYHATHDIEIEANGHTYRRRKDGKGWCRFSSPECGIPEGDLPPKVQESVKKIDGDAPETTKKTGDADAVDKDPPKTEDAPATGDKTPDTPEAPVTQTSRQKKFDSEIDDALKRGDITPEEAAIMKKYNEMNPSGGKTIDDIKADLKNNKVLNEDTGRFGDPDPNVSKRKEYMGSTPTKDSEIGAKVKKKMQDAGHYDPGPPELFKSLVDDEWYPIELADMSHKPKNMAEFPPPAKKQGSAVEYWNEEGKFHGAKSDEVRDFMKDPDNYYLEHKSYNRSDGAKMGKTYEDPVVK